MKRITFLFAVALLVLGIAGSVATGRVGAQSESTPEAGTTESVVDASAEEVQPEWITILAENLGLEPAVVADAVQQTLLDMVDARSEAIKAAIESGDISQLPGAFFPSGNFSPFPGIGIGGDFSQFPGMERGGDVTIISGEIGKSNGPEFAGGGISRGGQPGMGRGMNGGIHVMNFDALADFFGITTEELAQAFGNGQSLVEIGEANGKSAEDIKAFLLNEAEAAIDDLLTPADDAVPAEATPAADADAGLV